jgi:hypothetical protein
MEDAHYTFAFNATNKWVKQIITTTKVGCSSLA